jgi:hypothetical protein
MLGHWADTIISYGPDSICALSIYAQVICHAMGPIQYFLMDRTRSVHCKYMHKSYLGYGADTIFSYEPDLICTLPIYAQVICHAMGPIQLFLMDQTWSVHCKYMHK